jgi:LysR family transcriptional regulator, carnitine catabolism transcriptional activator
MDSRRLGIFLAVVDTGGFTAAAAELGMSQPAVSQAIRELESELGTPLFQRIGRGVTLTSAGEALIVPARQARHDLEVGKRAVEDVVGLTTGHLDLACLPTLAVAPLAPLVGAFRLAHPGVRIRLADPGGTDDLVELVRSGLAEVGMAEPVDSPGLRTVPLARQEFLVVLPPATPAPDPLPLARLAELPLVAAPLGTSTRGLLEEALRRVGGRPSVVVEAAQREAILPLVVGGAGASLLPRPLAEVAGALGCVVREPLPTVARSVALLHRDGPLTPAAGRFVELAVEESKR